MYHLSSIGHTHEVETTCNYACCRNISSSHCPIIWPARFSAIESNTCTSSATKNQVDSHMLPWWDVQIRHVQSCVQSRNVARLAPCLQTDPLVIQVQIQPKRKPQILAEVVSPRSPELASLPNVYTVWKNYVCKSPIHGTPRSNSVKRYLKMMGMWWWWDCSFTPSCFWSSKFILV